MNEKGWKRTIFNAVINRKTRKLLIQILMEAEQAKQELRNKGYGWMGLSLLETIQKEVPKQLEGE